MMGGSRIWQGLITRHALERFVERVTQKPIYGHLSICKTPSCPECSSLLFRLRKFLDMERRWQTNLIRRRLAESQNAGREVTDPTFLDVIRKHYGDVGVFRFWRDDEGVYVVKHPANEPYPVLVTVMGVEMIDGMVLQAGDPEHLQVYFDRQNEEAKDLTAISQDTQPSRTDPAWIALQRLQKIVDIAEKGRMST